MQALGRGAACEAVLEFDSETELRHQLASRPANSIFRDDVTRRRRVDAWLCAARSGTRSRSTRANVSNALGPAPARLHVG
jgi:hypothetical protein